MAHAPQVRIPATYMRGGTSKGVFFRLEDLPAAAQLPARRATLCCCGSSAARIPTGSRWTAWVARP